MLSFFPWLQLDATSLERLGHAPAWLGSLSGLDSMGGWWLLAQQGGGGGDAPVSPLSSMFPAMVAIMVLAYFMFMRPQQAKERQYREMVENLKENDHIVTTSGIHGVVTNVQRDQERVTVRIDDATGAKMRVSLWAIERVGPDDKANKPSQGKSGQSKSNDNKSKK